MQISRSGARFWNDDAGASLVVFRTDELARLQVPEGMGIEERHCEHRLALYASGLDSSVRVNLLQGEYSPRQSFDKTWKPWRATAALAACIGLVLCAGNATPAASSAGGA